MSEDKAGEQVEMGSDSQTAPLETQISIQIEDIISALRIIEAAIERNAFKPRELLEVTPTYQKLLTFHDQIRKSEDAAKQEKGE